MTTLTLVFITLFAGAIFGGVLVAALALSGTQDLEDDNMRLREELANLENVNRELRLFMERQSGECADGTELGR